MKHRNQLTNRIALELAFPVDRRGVLSRSTKILRQPISTPQLFHMPTETESHPFACLPPALYSSPRHIQNPYGRFNAHKASCSGAV